MSRTLRLLWSIGLAALASSAVDAAADIRLRVAFPVNPPWSYYDVDCRPTGITIENLERLATEAGLRFDYVEVPVSVREDALRDARIDLAAAHPALNGTFRDYRPQPFGREFDIIAIGPVIRDGHLPPIEPSLRVGARNATVAAEFGLGAATILPNEDFGALVDALLSRRVDLVAGHREALYFALLRRGVDLVPLRRQTATVTHSRVFFHLAPDADRRYGILLRSAALHMDWNGSQQQLRRRYLTPAVARAVPEQATCQDSARSPTVDAAVRSGGD